MGAGGGQVVALSVKAAEGWRVGDLVRVREGRGHIFEFSALGAYAVIKLIATGRKVTVRVAELQSGRLS